MGQSASADQGDTNDLIRDYTLESKCEQGTLLRHRTSKEGYLLKEVSFMDQDEYQKALEKYKARKNRPPRENLLNLVEVQGRVKANFCSGTYKLYLIYEFPSITLQEEIAARARQTRFFEEQDLWSIMQSCLNGLSELGEPVQLEPHKIFIMNDGLVKIVDPDALSDGSRFVLSQGVYYAPERFQNFTRTDRGNSSEKETIFGLGMSLLHAATLEDAFDCYNYEQHKFLTRKLQDRLAKLEGMYSEEFVFVLVNLLEMNPNRRASMLELQDVIHKFWSKEDQEEAQLQDADDSEQRVPTVQTKPQNFNNVMRLKKDDLQMTNKVTFSEICDVQKVRQRQDKLSSLKQVKSGLESASGKTEQRRSDTRKPLEVVQNFVLPQMSKPSFSPYSEKYAPPAQQVSSTYVSSMPSVPPYVSSYSYLNPISPSFYIPPSSSSNENLFTDPKLLELLRKDLCQINTRRTLSRQTTFDNIYVPNTYTSIVPSTYELPRTNLEPLSTIPLTCTSTLVHSVQNNIATNPPQISQQIHSVTHISSANPPSSEPKAELVREVYEDGRVYEGPVLNGMKEGKGILTYPDGAYYEGEFSKNRMHGYGVLYYRVGKPAYQGNWFEDQFHGEGILYNENPMEQLQPFDYTDFNLVEDYWVRYEGEFRYDDKHGHGRLLLANGEYFEGNFEKDSIHGQGTFYDKFGNAKAGTWDNNMLSC